MLRYHNVIMTVGGEDVSQKYFRDRKMYLREVNMKYGCSAVFIRHDSAEIWGFRYGLTLGIGTLKIMASAGVFVRVILLLNALLAVTQKFQALF
jgi:hypothetical protein